jgi:hypothetical protein
MENPAQRNPPAASRILQFSSLVLLLAGLAPPLALAQRIAEEVSLREELTTDQPKVLEEQPKSAFGWSEILQALTKPPPETAPVDPNYPIGPRDQVIINL